MATVFCPKGAMEISLGQATNGSAALGKRVSCERALKGHRNASTHSGAPSGHDMNCPCPEGGARYRELALG